MSIISIHFEGFKHLGREHHHYFIYVKLNQQCKQSLLLLEALLFFPKALEAEIMERNGMRRNTVCEGLAEMGVGRGLSSALH